ncbi:Os06g0341400 [Oryza sativa Japonica Group]|uniref:Os06g0341400 protein n=2 Tax=Oryza sativa subsp. japonica TaxID=39947 RepID=Q0DCE2_ORYSJ|nr:Os06g0341400 [Oryza sativa Japonica Group]BAS97625.1 Os06g0341400 [Oryza sativa Japonica Group]|eukprot:NP_001057567.1 Os06g0341400 [Oryza sativa Japonica Group]
MEALRRPEVVVNRRWSRSRLLPLLLPVARPSAPAPALEYGKICKEPVLVYDSRMPENVFDASKMIFFFFTLARQDRGSVEEASRQRQRQRERGERRGEAGQHAHAGATAVRRQQQRAQAAVAGVERLVQRRAAGAADVPSCDADAGAGAGDRVLQARRQVQPLEHAAARRGDRLRPRHCCSSSSTEEDQQMEKSSGCV